MNIQNRRGMMLKHQKQFSQSVNAMTIETDEITMKKTCWKLLEMLNSLNLMKVAVRVMLMTQV